MRSIRSVLIVVLGITVLASGTAVAQRSKTTAPQVEQVEEEDDEVQEKNSAKNGAKNSQRGSRGSKVENNAGNGGVVTSPGDASGKSGIGNGGGNNRVIKGQTREGGFDFSGGSNNGNGGTVR